jgi:hypothetical protein
MVILFVVVATLTVNGEILEEISLVLSSLSKMGYLRLALALSLLPEGYRDGNH